MGAMERSLSQSGVPENSSASKPTVPASSACASVSETFGSVPLTNLKTGADSAARRTPGIAMAAKAMTNSHSRKPKTPVCPCTASALPDERGDGERAGPRPKRRLVHTESEDAGQQRDAKQKLSHTFSLRGRTLGGLGTGRKLARGALRWR